MTGNYKSVWKEWILFGSGFMKINAEADGWIGGWVVGGGR
jgi:hypothetical protein